MKHLRGEAVAEALAEAWAVRAETQFLETGAALIVPVPLHWRRRWQRGYNQSETLARILADKLHLPSRPHLLRRIRNTPHQVQQSATARQDNVRGAFVARRRPELIGTIVLLVDDVLTTGSTVNEAAKALRTAGAAKVFVAVAAVSRD
jgi:ComF family protein